MSSAGLVPVLELAEQAGRSKLIDVHVDIDSARVKSGAANPVGKLTSVIAGMCTGADVIDDMNLLRAGGMPALFDQVYAPRRRCGSSCASSPSGIACSAGRCCTDT